MGYGYDHSKQKDNKSTWDSANGGGVRSLLSAFDNSRQVDAPNQSGQANQYGYTGNNSASSFNNQTQGGNNE